jgi:hypothetical protein
MAQKAVAKPARKVVQPKAAAVKSKAKAAPARSSAKKVAAPKKGLSRGESLVCGTCGLVVTVDEACDCIEVHEVICCDEPMKVRAEKAKGAKK